MMKIFDQLRVSFRGMFRGQRQTIKDNANNVVAAQSKGGPATAQVTITPVLNNPAYLPKDNLADIEANIESMVKSQIDTAGTRPGGILVDEREFNVILRDLRPGQSHGKIQVLEREVTTYESTVTYDGTEWAFVQVRVGFWQTSFYLNLVTGETIPA